MKTIYIIILSLLLGSLAQAQSQIYGSNTDTLYTNLLLLNGSNIVSGVINATNTTNVFAGTHWQR